MPIVYVKAIRGRRRVLTQKCLSTMKQLLADSLKGHLFPLVTGPQIIAQVNPLITIMESDLALTTPKGDY